MPGAEADGGAGAGASSSSTAGEACAGVVNEFGALFAGFPGSV